MYPPAFVAAFEAWKAEQLAADPEADVTEDDYIEYLLAS